MKVRIPVLITALFLCLGMLTACFGAGPAPAQDDGSISVTVVNDTSYQFQEIYLSESTTDAWGSDVLGGTNVLKAGGSYGVTLDAAGNYDLKVVDEDDDAYRFDRLPLEDGMEISIALTENGQPLVGLTGASGSTQEIAGEWILDDTDVADTDVGDAPQTNFTGTGNDTAGYMEFTIYNESDYDIYAIFIGVANAAAEDDLDLLPAILPAHSDTVVSAVASSGDWMNTEWTMYVQDVDGDTSTSYEVFNPWTLQYVDITWDPDSFGYVCDFVY